MQRQFTRLLALAGALLLAATVCFAETPRAQITFDNKSGQACLVKLIGPTPRQVEVPDQKKRMVKVTGGRYYIKVRYGSDPDHYAYTKGDTFSVTQNRRQYSIITITLHKVVNGNYQTNPIDAKEFDKD